MQVTNVRVSFFREKQPAQYEKAQPMVELAAVLAEGEDHLGAARHLMLDAATVVYAGLGYAVPEKVAAALAKGETPMGSTVNVSMNTRANTAEDFKAQQTGTDVVAEAADKIKETFKGSEVAEDHADRVIDLTETDPPKKRGRPKGSKNTRPKSDTQAAADHLAKTDEIPGDSISTGETRVGPDDTPADHGVDDIPGEEAPAEAEVTTEPVEDAYTSKDLHAYMTQATRDQKITAQSARQVLTELGVARAQDLTPEKVIKGRKMIDLMIEAGAR